MLSLLGVDYLTDSITAAINERQKNELYRTYVTDAFYILCRFAGNPLKHRYYDILHPKPVHKDPDEDGKTGMEIAVGRLERCGFKVVG